MSFILDALRKSEIERQRQSGPSIAEFPVAREDRRLPIALIAIGFLLAVNLAVVLFFLLRDSQAPSAAVAAVPAPTAAAPSPPAAPAAPAAPAPEPTTQSALAMEALPPAEEPPAVYYDAPATLPPDAPDPTLVPDTPAASPDVVYADAPPEDAASVAAATGLPELTVDLHVFSNDPAKRAVFINGRRYIQGAQIAEGPTVEEITPEGAMLSWRGRRFLLPRL